jgi:MFS family permease
VSQPDQPQPYQSFGTPFGVPPEPEPGLPWAKAIAVTVAVFLVAGAIAGWAWQRFSPLAQYTVDERGGSLGEEQMTKIFGPDGTFTMIGFLTALVLGAALFWWLRNYGPWAVGIVALGSVLGGGVAWGVGMLLGHDPLQPRLEAAKPGDLLAAPLELHTWTPLVAWFVGAALAAAVIAAASWRSEPVATTSVSAASEGAPQVH